MKKRQLENRLYSVATMEEFTNTPDLFNPKYTAIQAHGLVMPIRSKIGDTGPGYYYQPGAMCCYVQKPEHPEDYSEEGIIDFTNLTDITQVLKNNELIRDIQQEIMTNSENILYLKIGDNDTPEMKAMKSAINAKQVDKKQYEPRFEQFQNDMRLLKGNSITLGKIVSISDAFDIAVELTLRDKPDAPNPMNTEITVDLTEGREVK